MAVPKKKISCSRRGQRRSHNALRSAAFLKDKESGLLRRPHHMDMGTGIYRGKMVISIKEEEETEN